jgi:hypothetical protein
MKHTIKLLTVAITLAAILTLTGCPGPVTPDKPCTHEHTRTEVIEKAAYNKDGLGKIICVDCEEVIDEQAEISRFVAGGYDGDIPAEVKNPETYRYEYTKEDDYQIMAYVYSSVEDAKKGENERVLHFSFPNDTTSISQIVTIDGQLCITIDNLIQMKSGYVGKTVKYFASGHINLSQIDIFEYLSGDLKPLTLLERKNIENTRVLPVYIVVE